MCPYEHIVQHSTCNDAMHDTHKIIMPYYFLIDVIGRAEASPPSLSTLTSTPEVVARKMIMNDYITPALQEYLRLQLCAWRLTRGRSHAKEYENASSACSFSRSFSGKY